jgi:hemerythrin-like domain-containing protein
MEMKFIGPLMWEHRLIEKMLHFFPGKIAEVEKNNKVDPVFIDTAVDFIRTYADRTHHGKEEDILFRDLAKKKMSSKHAKIVQELVDEHIYARKTVGRLVEAKDRYLKGDVGAVKAVIGCLIELADFYPKHIEKEDKHFFFPCMDYFTKEEQDTMLQEFWEFDRNMIHEKYRKVVERLETESKG